MTSYYAIPLENNRNVEYTHNAIKLVNYVLNLGVDAWWLQKRLRGENRVYSKGDFVIAINSFNEVIINYFLKMADELGVTVYLDSALNKSGLVTTARKMIKPEIAVYYGNGTTGGAIWFIHALEKMGFDIGIVTEKDIFEGALENYNVVLLGSGGYYCSHLGKEGCKKVAEFVYNGGGYIGHCGGSVAAVNGYPKSSPSSRLELADVRLELKESGNILSAYARGPVIYNVTMPEHPVMFGYEGNISLVYWCGPIFSSEVGKNVSALATILAPSPDIQSTNPELTRVKSITPSTKALTNSTGKPAILSANYGHGKIMLFSPHPESPGSEHSYRLLANEVFYVTSFSESHKPKEPGALDIYTRHLQNENDIVSLEKLLQEINRAVGMMRGLVDKDTIVYGAIAEFMLLYLNDSADRLGKIKIFDTHEFAFGRTSNEYVRNLVDDAIKKQVMAIDRISRLTEPETIEVVKNTITFLSGHRKSLNKTLNLCNKLNGSITDEYANLVKREYSAYTNALDAYKYGVEAKILDASFAVTRAEEAAKLCGKSNSLFT